MTEPKATSPSIEQVTEETSLAHYPELYRRVVMIVHEHEDTGTPHQIGSGVLVNVEGRHFVATAAHCIRRNPCVIREGQWNPNTSAPLPQRSAVIIRAGTHKLLDIGFLEVATVLGPEIGEEQLYFNQGLALQPHWSLHVIGYPVKTIAKSEPLQMMTMRKKAFVSNMAEQADTYIKIYYPEVGYRLESGQWVETRFVETPHGFSGGGCFIISERPGEVAVLGHKLIGIQSCWYRESRLVEVIPIKPWYNMVKAYLASPPRG
jgi:hypothetical protein